MDRRAFIKSGAVTTASIAFSSAVLPVGSHAASVSNGSSFSFTERDLELAFEELFTKALVFDGGSWKVNLQYKGDLFGEDLRDLKMAADGLNNLEDVISPYSISYASRMNPGMAPQGPKEFVTCVFKGVLPGSIVVFMDWNAVYFWIKQRSWGKLSSYVMKHAVKYGIRDLAKFTPGGLALSIAAAAIGCAVHG